MTITTIRGLAGLRRRAMLTQAELADRLGVAQQRVNEWERGVKTPRPATQRALCTALNATGEELLAALDESAAEADGQQPRIGRRPRQVPGNVYCSHTLAA